MSSSSSSSSSSFFSSSASAAAPPPPPSPPPAAPPVAGAPPPPASRHDGSSHEGHMDASWLGMGNLLSSCPPRAAHSDPEGSTLECNSIGCGLLAVRYRKMSGRCRSPSAFLLPLPDTALLPNCRCTFCRSRRCCAPLCLPGHETISKLPAGELQPPPGCAMLRLAGVRRERTSAHIADEVLDGGLLKQLGEQARPVGVDRHVGSLDQGADVVSLRMKRACTFASYIREHIRQSKRVSCCDAATAPGYPPAVDGCDCTRGVQPGVLTARSIPGCSSP